MLKWLDPNYRAIRARYMARFRQWDELRQHYPEQARTQLEERMELHRVRTSAESADGAAHSLLHLLDLSAMSGQPWKHVEPNVLEALAQGEL